jgi:hypothetical protein
MGYVMVPVPEHHQQEFGQWLLQQTLRAAFATWSPQKLQAAADRLDDEDRRIVTRIASVRGFWVDGPTVADDLGIPLDALMQRVQSMNDDAYEADSPAVVMVKSADQSRSGRPEFMMDNAIRVDLLALLT